ncbi:hypothetical protein ACN6MT_28145 [Neobacillus niacini]
MTSSLSNLLWNLRLQYEKAKALQQKGFLFV